MLSALNEIWCWDSESTCHAFDIFDLSELGCVSSVSITSGLRSDSNNSSVNSARNAVLLLEIDLWEVESFVGVISVVVHDVFSGRLIDQLSHGESLDSLILWDDSMAVQASDHIGMTLVLLASSVVSSL